MTSIDVHAGIRLQVLRSAVGHFHSAVENRESMATLRLVHVMGRHHDRRAVFGKAKQVGPEVPAALRIDRAGRFVQ